MAKSVQNYIDELYSQGKTEADRLKEQRTQADDKLIQQTNAAIDKAAAASAKPYQTQLDELPALYGKLYDANAVQELVNRRQVQETMANMGLTDSGLNRTQQTAIALQRGNADAQVRLSQQQKTQELQDRIDQLLGNSAAQKIQQEADIRNATERWYGSALESLRSSAAQQGTSAYNAQMQAQAAEAKAREQEAALAAQAAIAQQAWNKFNAIFSRNAAANPETSSGGEILPAELRTYTKTKDTINGFGGIDNNDIVKDQYGVEYRIDQLPKSIQQALTDLKLGESYTGTELQQEPEFVQDLTEVDPTLLIKNVPEGNWTDSEIAEIASNVSDTGAAVFNVSPQERRDKMDKEIKRLYLQMRDGYVEHRDDFRFNRGYGKSAIINMLQMMNSHAPKQYDFTSGEIQYISDMTWAMLEQAYKRAH